MNLEGSTLLIDRIDMYTLEGSVGEWVHLASIPLGGNGNRLNILYLASNKNEILIFLNQIKYSQIFR